MSKHIDLDQLKPEMTPRAWSVFAQITRMWLRGAEIERAAKIYWNERTDKALKDLYDKLTVPEPAPPELSKEEIDRIDAEHPMFQEPEGDTQERG